MATEVSVPIGLLRRLLGAANELAGLVPSAKSEETVQVPGQGEWSRVKLEDLQRHIEGYKGAVALLNLAAERPDQVIRYHEVVEAAKVPERQVRADLGAMTKASRRLFTRPGWLLRAWQASDGEMSYVMQEKIARWWLGQA